MIATPPTPFEHSLDYVDNCRVTSRADRRTHAHPYGLTSLLWKARIEAKTYKPLHWHAFASLTMLEIAYSVYDKGVLRWLKTSSSIAQLR